MDPGPGATTAAAPRTRRPSPCRRGRADEEPHLGEVQTAFAASRPLAVTVDDAVEWKQWPTRLACCAPRTAWRIRLRPFLTDLEHHDTTTTTTPRHHIPPSEASRDSSPRPSEVSPGAVEGRVSPNAQSTWSHRGPFPPLPRGAAPRVERDKHGGTSTSGDAEVKDARRRQLPRLSTRETRDG